MRRRRFVGLVGAGLVSGAILPIAGWAQRPTPRRIGVLVLGNPDPTVFLKELRDGLAKLGQVEGQDIQFEFRSAGGDASKLPEAAADLVRQKVDIIVAWQTPAASAAKRATTDIPVVMSSGNPVGTGVVSSLSRPGGNVTGVDSFGAQLGAKCVEFVRDLIPGAMKVAILCNAADPFTTSFFAEVSGAARDVNLATLPVYRLPGDALDTAFDDMRNAKADAVIIQPTLLRPGAIELALKARLPSLSFVAALPRSGGLLAYTTDNTELIRQMAHYVDRVLKGMKPADMPVWQPTKFQLIINLKTARALGLNISPTLLARADELIE